METAAIVFGGSPCDYATSTNGPDPSQIDFKGWVDGWAEQCQAQPEDYSLSQYIGSFFNNPVFVGACNGDGRYHYVGDRSAYISDHGCPDTFVFSKNKKRSKIHETPKRTSQCTDGNMWCAKEYSCIPSEPTSNAIYDRCFSNSTKNHQ